MQHRKYWLGTKIVGECIEQRKLFYHRATGPVERYVGEGKKEQERVQLQNFVNNVCLLPLLLSKDPPFPSHLKVFSLSSGMGPLALFWPGLTCPSQQCPHHCIQPGAWPSLVNCPALLRPLGYDPLGAKRFGF